MPSPLPAPAALGQTSGPGVGLQLVNTSGHAGRLLFVGWRDLHAGKSDGDVVWYSDDGGATYALGATFESGWSEAQLAETTNGSIIAILRNYGEPPRLGRGIALSNDGGATFGPIRHSTNLTVNDTCQASLLRAPANGRIYFSAPRVECMTRDCTIEGRAEGVVRSSADGIHWSATEHVLNISGVDVAHGKSFGYSCLTRVRTPGFVGLLYEAWVGGWTHANGHKSGVDLVFTMVPLEL